MYFDGMAGRIHCCIGYGMSGEIPRYGHEHSAGFWGEREGSGERSMQQGKE